MGTWKHRLSNIDPVTFEADCASCGRTTTYESRTGRGGRRCRSAIQKNERERYRHRRKKGTVCAKCGFRGQRCQMDVDHIDGDWRNDVPENWQTLCANCHRLKTEFARLSQSLAYHPRNDE